MALYRPFDTVYAFGWGGSRVSALTDARDFVAGALAGLGVNVYQTGNQAGITPPCVIIEPAQNWVEQQTLKQSRVNFDLKVTAQPAGTNEAAMQRLEDLVWQIQAIFPLSGAVSAPNSEKVGQSDQLTTTVPISVQVSE